MMQPAFTLYHKMADGSYFLAREVEDIRVRGTSVDYGELEQVSRDSLLERGLDIFRVEFDTFKSRSPMPAALVGHGLLRGTAGSSRATNVYGCPRSKAQGSRSTPRIVFGTSLSFPAHWSRWSTFHERMPSSLH